MRMTKIYIQIIEIQNINFDCESYGLFLAGVISRIKRHQLAMLQVLKNV